MSSSQTRQLATTVTRRQALRLAAGAVAGYGSGWLPALARDAADHASRKRSCIVLWMSGGPSQTDTFDPKPGHAHGGISSGRSGLPERLQFLEFFAPTYS